MNDYSDEHRWETAVRKLGDKIRELERIVDDQKTDIWRLEDRVNNLESEIRSLENEVRYK